jgi:polyhydroxybutyrate depolymerase
VQALAPSFSQDPLQGLMNGEQSRRGYLMRTQTKWLTLCLAITAFLPAAAQNALERKGVSYWGQPAAQKLYTSTPPSARPGQPMRGSQSIGRETATSSGGQLRNFEVVSGGVRHQAFIYTPTTYKPATKMPVILVFHGLGGSSRDMPVYTGMNGAAERNGFIVVYPNGSGSRWDDGFTAGDKGDVAFIQDLLAALPSVVNIDQRHVYACGMSNGGFFSERLACEIPEKISAIAVVAATGFNSVMSRCSSPAVPVMFFVGTDDPLIPYDASKMMLASRLPGGGADLAGALTQMGGLYSASQAVDYWLKRNGSNPNPRSHNIPHLNRDAGRVLCEDYGSGRNEVVVYTVENGGHTWPGGLPVLENKLGVTSQDINASDLICQFFRNH